MSEAPSPSSCVGLALVGPRAAKGEVVFIPVVLLPRVCSSWDVSGEDTKYLLGSCFGFFQYRQKKWM